MPFDPSIISKIPSMGPNPGAAVERAYQLKDMIDEGQVRDLQLGQLKRQEQEQDAQREILKNTDLSNPQGWMDASQKLAKAGFPDAAIAMQRQYQNMVSSGLKLEQTKQGLEAGHVKLLTAFSNIIGPAAVTIKQTLQTKGPAMAMAQYQQMLPQILQGLPPELASRLPRTPPQDPQEFSALLDRAIASSTQAQNMLKQNTEAQKLKVLQAAETERERHDRTQEGIAKTKAAGQGFTPREQDLLAALADRHVSLPAGMRSQADIKAEVAGLIKRHPDMTSDQIADGLLSGTLKFTAESKGASVAGTQIGKVALAANELDTFGEQTIAASSALPRGTFVPWNKLKNMSRGQISDPKLLVFKSKMQALENAYDQLAARGGTDVDKRDRIHAMFDTANSPQAVQALVQALNQEAAGARAAADRTIAETSGSAIPGTGKPLPADSMVSIPPDPSAAPAASNAPTATGPNGQRLVLKNGQWVPLGQ